MSGPERERPNVGPEKDARLRQLLNEAVEPVQPSPGAQARLFARMRAGQTSRRSGARRWAVAGSAVAAVAIVAVGAVLATGDSHGSSSSTSSAGSAAAVPSPAAAPSSSAKSADSAALGASAAPPPAAEREAGPLAAGGAAPAGMDLDGDDRPDALSLQGSTLTAQLSRYGTQTVRLPEAAGVGAGVAGSRRMATVAGGTIPVAFVRLVAGQGPWSYTAVAVVDGRLSVLRLNGQPVVLVSDAGHGFACDSRGSLALHGDPTPYVVSGDQLVPAKQLYAVNAPAPGAAC